MMELKNKCHIIKDLLPSYIDNIVSDESIKIVEEHLTSCENCKKSYETMKEESLKPSEASISTGNYLKKIRTYEKKLILSGLGISFLLGMALYVLVLTIPTIIDLINGIEIPDYKIKRIYVAWWVGIIKMITAGCFASTIYTLVQLGIKRIHDHQRDGFLEKIFSLCLVFSICCIFTFVFSQAFIMIVGIVAIVVIGLYKK